MHPCRSSIAMALALFAVGPSLAADGPQLVAIGGSLIGGVRSHRLLPLDSAGDWAKLARKPWTVSAPGLGPLSAKFKSLETDDEHCTGGTMVLDQPKVPSEASPVVAIQGAWNVFPRVAKRTSSDQKVYRDVVAAILAKHGLADAKVVVDRIDRVDLDGDGTEEVVIHAEAAGRDSQDKETGLVSHGFAYSVVILRRVVGGAVQDQLLEVPGSLGSQVRSDAFVRTSIEGYADLDGDGSLEIILSENGVDYGGTAVWKLGSKGWSKIAHESCGA